MLSSPLKSAARARCAASVKQPDRVKAGLGSPGDQLAAGQAGGSREEGTKEWRGPQAKRKGGHGDDRPVPVCWCGCQQVNERDNRLASRRPAKERTSDPLKSSRQRTGLGFSGCVPHAFPKRFPFTSSADLVVSFLISHGTAGRHISIDRRNPSLRLKLLACGHGFTPALSPPSWAFRHGRPM
jgi:hypothetical protein